MVATPCTLRVEAQDREMTFLPMRVGTLTGGPRTSGSTRCVKTN